MTHLSTQQPGPGLGVGPENGGQVLSELLQKELASRWAGGAVTGDLQDILGHVLLPLESSFATCCFWNP